MKTLNQIIILIKRFIWPTFVAGILFAIVLFITLIFGNIYKDNPSLLQTFSSVLSIFTSLILFGIAISIYKHFDTNQLLLDKQTNEVLNLMELIQGVSISVEYHLKEEGTGYGHNLYVNPLKDIRKGGVRYSIFNKNIKNKQYGKPSLFNYFELLIRTAGSPYMPNSISSKIIEQFDMKSIFAVGISEKPKYYNDFIISVLLNVRTNLDYFERTMEYDAEGEEDRFVNRYNEKEIDIDDILLNLRDIYKMAYYWLKKNNSEMIDGLNVYHL